MDISKILQTNYANCEWTLKGNSYVGLTWHDAETAKPNEAELQEMWDSEEFQIKVNNNEIIDNRKRAILSAWPANKQFEALTEAQMGRPEKLNELINYINSTKEEYPKV